MEQKHNPYAPTRVPLSDESPGPEARREYELEYGGFWRRLAALLLDSLMLLPLFAINYVGAQWSRMYFVYAAVPGLLFAAFYWIWLVARFGGTPGKRALKMRVALEDGTPVTGLAAFRRYTPLLVLGALSAWSTAAAAYRVTDAAYLPLSYLEKLVYLDQMAPAWKTRVSLAMFLWIAGCAIVMLCNYRRRAIHDYIAGTVVLREG
jgi:uncharacterized RDD family membrane protein YckC